MLFASYDAAIFFSKKTENVTDYIVQLKDSELFMRMYLLLYQLS